MPKTKWWRDYEIFFVFCMIFSICENNVVKNCLIKKAPGGIRKIWKCNLMKWFLRTIPLFTKYKSKRKASQQRTFRISQLAAGCTEKYYLCQKSRLKKHNPITSYDQSTSAECQNQWNFKIVKIYNVQPPTANLAAHDFNGNSLNQ